MKWIHDYQLFLFDFDGLLVNTEEIHFLAYQRMCSGRGIHLDWDFNRYIQAAHYSAHALRDQLYASFPRLKQEKVAWEQLYAEKKQAVCDLICEGAIQLMPGVETILKHLQHHHKKRCVVTNSPPELVALIRKQHEILNTIPVWVTREQYHLPKPDPECYLKAIELLADEKDRIIGFEDSPRGLTALMGTRAQPVLISPNSYPEIPSFIAQGALYFRSFQEYCCSS